MIAVTAPPKLTQHGQPFANGHCGGQYIEHKARQTSTHGTGADGCMYDSSSNTRPEETSGILQANRRLEREGPPWSMVSQREARRLRVVSWNTGGLTGPRYSEMLEWLRQEELAGRTVDICVLQETAWRQDMEYNTQVPGEETSGLHAIHSAGREKTGILCLIRRGLLPPTSIRSVARDPGRLLHIRLLLRPRLISCVCTRRLGTRTNPP